MDISVNVLRKDTVALIREIDKQLENVAPLDPAHIPNTLAILLNAKATAYNTLVMLQAKK
jgi:hypothetical protein